jgi:hypothetical protein
MGVLALLYLADGPAGPVRADASLPLAGTLTYNSLTNEGTGFLSSVGPVQLNSQGIVAGSGDGFQAWFVSASVFPDGSVTGSFQILSGTGRYARWSGQGTVTGTFDLATHQFDLKLAGQWSLATGRPSLVEAPHRISRPSDRIHETRVAR